MNTATRTGNERTEARKEPFLSLYTLPDGTRLPATPKPRHLALQRLVGCLLLVGGVVAGTLASLGDEPFGMAPSFGVLGLIGFGYLAGLWQIFGAYRTIGPPSLGRGVTFPFGPFERVILALAILVGLPSWLLVGLWAWPVSTMVFLFLGWWDWRLVYAPAYRPRAVDCQYSLSGLFKMLTIAAVLLGCFAALFRSAGIDGVLYPVAVIGWPVAASLSCVTWFFPQPLAYWLIAAVTVALLLVGGSVSAATNDPGALAAVAANLLVCQFAACCASAAGWRMVRIPVTERPRPFLR